jgi:hypothetical protein
MNTGVQRKDNPMSGIITKNGIYSGIPLDTYHEQLCWLPSTSSSDLRTLMSESPAHCFCTSSLNPEREEEKDTSAMALGRAAHHLLLGEDEFSTLFIARPETFAGKDWQGNRKECREWIEKQTNAGRTVLKSDQIKAIRGMAKSLAAHPLVKSGILNGEIERSMFVLHKETQIVVKTRPDAIPTDSGDFSDLKTTSSVRFDDLQRTIAEYGYHQQAALVGWTYQQLTGRPMTSFSFVFVENKPPHCVRVVTLKDADLARGHDQNMTALRIMRRCLDSGVWPGPGDYNEADFIELPTWKQTRIDTDLAYLKTTLPIKDVA